MNHACGRWTFRALPCTPTMPLDVSTPDSQSRKNRGTLGERPSPTVFYNIPELRLRCNRQIGVFFGLMTRSGPSRTPDTALAPAVRQGRTHTAGTVIASVGSRAESPRSRREPTPPAAAPPPPTAAPTRSSERTGAGSLLARTTTASKPRREVRREIPFPNRVAPRSRSADTRSGRLHTECTSPSAHPAPRPATTPGPTRQWPRRQAARASSPSTRT